MLNSQSLTKSLPSRIVVTANMISMACRVPIKKVVILTVEEEFQWETEPRWGSTIMALVVKLTRMKQNHTSHTDKDLD